MAKSINIIIPEGELMKTKSKQGLYRKLSEPTPSTVITIPLIEQAFRCYAKRHGCKPAMENIEWNRFHKILKEFL
jgi:hypothetical protein